MDWITQTLTSWPVGIQLPVVLLVVLPISVVGATLLLRVIDAVTEKLTSK